MLEVFIRSDIFRVLREATIVGREVPFAIPWSTSESRHAVMEGIIDLVYRLNGDIWIAEHLLVGVMFGYSEQKGDFGGPGGSYKLRQPIGTLYAGWDTQSRSRDTAWLAWSTNGGRRWSRPLRAAASRTGHLTAVAAAGRGSVYVAWQTIVGGKGYATFLRRYSLAKGWTSAAKRVSPAYGNPKVWPGDTFGLSTKGGSALLGWGSANNRQRGSQIYFTAVKLPAR